MSKNTKIPDAWDDDWETLADRAEREEPEPQPEIPVPMTRAERLAKHADEQRKLWESAEAPQEINYLAATTTVPLATPFKPAVKLLSRKPAPQKIAKKDPVTGLEQLTLVDDEEEEGSKKPQETPEEIRMRQQRELEEKQRRYEEARAKIFGESNPSSGQSTPGSVTPPQSGDGRHGHRGRGGRGRGRGDARRHDNLRQDDQNRRPQNNPPPGTRELYDPGYSSKPGFNQQKRDGDASPQRISRSETPREEDQIIRAPRGPDGSGRGGFYFSRRGAREG